MVSAWLFTIALALVVLAVCWQAFGWFLVQCAYWYVVNVYHPVIGRLLGRPFLGTLWVLVSLAAIVAAARCL